MKAWDKLTPRMKSAAVMIGIRQKLWIELKESPTMSANKVDKITKLIGGLTKQINRRSFSADEVDQLLDDVVRYSRNYRRIAGKLKISKRAVKFLIKKSHAKRKSKRPVKQVSSLHRQAKDLFCS